MKILKAVVIGLPLLLVGSFAGNNLAQNQNPLTERAYQDREILYELKSPESHAFRITHDYTVRKVGEKYYFNVVRAGSHVSDPESIVLDTGAKLKCEIITGKQATERKLPITDTIKDDSEIVVTHLTRALEPGTTNRIRLMETYADPKSYYLDSDELVWDRALGVCVIRWCCRPVGISRGWPRPQQSRRFPTVAFQSMS